MELMLQWFWIMKALVFVAFATSIYQLYVSEFKSKKWWILMIVGAILLLVNPIKMDTGIRGKQVQSNQIIESTKVLPEKVSDNSFEKSKEGLGIKKEELP